MPTSGSRRPPAPTCEDCWDEDTQSHLSDSRASANVSVKRSKSTEFDSNSVAGKKNHDGSDSGYSSKAGTSDSMSTASVKRGADLKINTQPIELERERHPYTFAPSPPEGSRSPTKSKAVKTDKTPDTPSRFRHKDGRCWVCDQYGYHFDLDKEFTRPATAAPAQTQTDTKSSTPKARAKEESDSRPSTSRRSSSTRRDNRPVSMYAAPGSFTYTPQPMDHGHPMLLAHGWQPPTQHVSPYHPYQYPYPPPTPQSATYGHPGFFDMGSMHMPPNDPAYGHPGFNGYHEAHRQSKPSSHDGDIQRSNSRDTRPRSTTQKSRKHAEPDQYAMERVIADRISMPPPPKPEAVRPVIKKASTEYPSVPLRRRSVFDSDDDEHPEHQTIPARERNSSHSRPPSSYKAPPTAETYGRPRPRKSSSYSTSSGTVHVASSSSQREMPRRRTDPLDQKVSDVENYVAKTNKQKDVEMEAYLTKLRKQKEADYDHYMLKAAKGPINPSLTAETLRRFEQKHSGTMSDAGSVRSKQSSSKESAGGRARAATALTNVAGGTNITMENGFCLTIPAEYSDVPLDIMVGNLRLSNINPIRDEELYPREQKQIERAPSEISHTSRRSVTSGSGVSVSKGKEDFSESGRTKQNANSSKRSSRATSSNRPGKDTRSIDYSLLDESYYLEY